MATFVNSMRYSRVPLWAWVAVLPLHFVSGQSVIINEIMYHPASQDPREEYIELFNAGATNVDLTGWSISGGVDFLFPNSTTLNAGRYLVVAAHRQAFGNKYPGVTNVVGSWLTFTVTNVGSALVTNWTPVLSNRRNAINLNDAQDRRIDS